MHADFYLENSILHICFAHTGTGGKIYKYDDRMGMLTKTNTLRCAAVCVSQLCMWLLSSVARNKNIVSTKFYEKKFYWL